jgi:hypothetical protein
VAEKQSVTKKLNKIKSERNTYIFKSCSSGQCIADPNAPTGDCIYGDDYVSGADINYLVSFTNTYTTCSAAINTLVQNGLDPVFWCNSTLFPFGKKCCQTCKGKPIK